jgi:hypothetical protein
MHDADGYEVDVDRLATRAGQFEPLAGRIAAIHRTLTDALGAEGTCWGTDVVGESFASAHAGPATDTETALSGLSGRISTVGTKLTDTAGTYGAGEDVAVEHLRVPEQ